MYMTDEPDLSSSTLPIPPCTRRATGGTKESGYTGKVLPRSLSPLSPKHAQALHPSVAPYSSEDDSGFSDDPDSRMLSGPSLTHSTRPLHPYASSHLGKPLDEGDDESLRDEEEEEEERRRRQMEEEEEDEILRRMDHELDDDLDLSLDLGGFKGGEEEMTEEMELLYESLTTAQDRAREAEAKVDDLRALLAREAQGRLEMETECDVLRGEMSRLRTVQLQRKDTSKTLVGEDRYVYRKGRRNKADSEPIRPTSSFYGEEGEEEEEEEGGEEGEEEEGLMDQDPGSSDQATQERLLELEEQLHAWEEWGMETQASAGKAIRRWEALQGEVRSLKSSLLRLHASWGLEIPEGDAEDLQNEVEQEEEKEEEEEEKEDIRGRGITMESTTSQWSAKATQGDHRLGEMDEERFQGEDGAIVYDAHFGQVSQEDLEITRIVDEDGEMSSRSRASSTHGLCTCGGRVRPGSSGPQGGQGEDLAQQGSSSMAMEIGPASLTQMTRDGRDVIPQVQEKASAPSWLGRLFCLSS
ncbi:MAG: hypothetical protein DHS80DRAFT_24674 [Piptocephalis tieghemiana]|nr:MAG: hypothetical protein DHS80DRAFT_24674 [Piptocephalis tieghemiana]